MNKTISEAIHDAVNKTINESIYDAVKACGYLNGYADDQLLARQICALQKELAELARDVVLPVTAIGNVKGMILSAGLAARQVFDTPGIWLHCGPIEHPETAERLYHELADCYVVLAVIEQTLRRLFPGEPISVQSLALAKAEAEADVIWGRQ